MGLNTLYILRKDFELTPVTDLGEGTKKKFDWELGDYLLSSDVSRANSQIIDKDAAMLLLEFRNAKTFIEAVISFSLKNFLDAKETLERSHTFLFRLREQEILIPFTDKEIVAKTAPLYLNGHKFMDYQIMECVSCVEDTDVYRISDTWGCLFCLKIAKSSNKSLIASFENEIEILLSLDSFITPKLFLTGDHKGFPFIITEWIEGINLIDYATTIRNQRFSNAFEELKNLCLKVLEAYIHIHKQQVIHSDVHPKNVIITKDKRAKLIDFGLSNFSGRDVRRIQRGGVAFYFEPEYAKARLNRRSIPTATFLGEQYSIAAMLFLVYTGRHYLDFSYEKDKALKQIAQDLPKPFSDFDLYGYETFEKALRKALDKEPKGRFASLNEFYTQIVNSKPIVSLLNSNSSALLSFSERLRITVSRLSLSSPIIKKGLSLHPNSSINLGAAGLAYFFYRIACLFNDAEFLTTSEVWIQRALQNIESKNGFFNNELGLSAHTVDPASLYHSATGIHCMHALILSAKGNRQLMNHAIQQFILSASNPLRLLDLSTGRSGLLIGCALLLECIGNDNYPERSNLINLGSNTLKEIWKIMDKMSPISECKEFPYWGIAHGWAGVLYATLLWCSISEQSVPFNLSLRINQLINCGDMKDNFISWRKGIKDNVSWSGWCHGTAGYIHLWTLASRYFKTDDFNKLAILSANHVIDCNKERNSNLCCGHAGEAYALLNMYKYSKKEVYLEEARRIRDIGIANLVNSNLIGNSLYKGEIGIALLDADLKMPFFSSMPFFEPHGF